MLGQRLLANVTQGVSGDHAEFVEACSSRLESAQGRVQQKLNAKPEARVAQALKRQEQTYKAGINLLAAQESVLASGQSAWSVEQARAAWTATSVPRRIELQGRNPFVQALVVDWANDKLVLELYPDVVALRTGTPSSELQARQRDRVDQLLVDQLAAVRQETQEELLPAGDGFAVNMASLTNSNSVLALRLDAVAQQELAQTQQRIQKGWQPTSKELERGNLSPLSSWSQWQQSRSGDFGLVFYAPVVGGESEGFRKSSLYVVGQGIGQLIDKAKDYPEAPESRALSNDLEQAVEMMHQDGWIVYSGAMAGMPSQYSQDLIFELPNYTMRCLRRHAKRFK